ncbi:MAG: J domain-containing protein [Candidatus Tectimicrobiota bacterium]
MKSLASCYTLLGLAPGASREDIKRAYRTLAKGCHPDRCAVAGLQRQEAVEQFHRLTAAYHALLREPGRHEAPACFLGVVWAWLRSRRRGALGGLTLVLSTLLSLWLFIPPPSPVLRSPVIRSTTSMPAEVPAPRPYITVGSTPEEVRAIQGPPAYASERLWEYRGSRLYFRDGRVSGWDIWPAAPLQVHLLPTVQVMPRPTWFSRGSSKDEVLTVQGTPTRLTEHVWEYGASRVFFTDNRVSTWDEWPGAPLMTRSPGATAAP